ncbi:MAG: TetR family transcriptional regulator [Nocardioides sp.]|uniref:TetR/AcrR family transcriptional regulator n=1 Tax=Nocardioides sp. TaxID=35761 RepID=UPI0032636A09
MTEPSQLSARRRQILDAAVTVLATQGWRGLTHRAIDRAAGLPEGSSSAYYRSRSALQAAMAAYVVWQLAADVETLATELDERPGDHDHAVAAIGATFRRWLDESDLLTARLELTMAAARDDDLAVQLRDSRQSLTTIVDDIMVRGGHAHSGAVSATIVAALDGVLISALLRPPAQRADFVADSLDLLLGSLVEGRPTQ